MNKHFKNISLIVISLIIFFALSYFLNASFGVAHIVLLAAALYAIVLNILALKGHNLL